MADIWIPVGVGVASSVAGFIGAWFLQPLVTHQLALRRGYYAPFSMWCARAASNIDELLYWVQKWPDLTARPRLSQPVPSTHRRLWPRWPLRKQSPDEENKRRFVSYQVAANFLETHDILAQAFSHGWTSELEKKGILHTLFAANYAVEKGYHLSELQAEVIWSALRPEDRERHLYDERLAQSLWDMVLGEADTRQALRDLGDGLKRFVP